MQNIEQELFREHMNNDDVVIIDVRTQQEVDGGFIKGMIHSDFFDQVNFMEFLEGLDRDKKYFMVCRSGNRSGQACMMMDQMGFENTYNLVGGMMAWTGDVEK